VSILSLAVASLLLPGYKPLSVARDTGFQVKGYLAGDRLEDRIDAFLGAARARLAQRVPVGGAGAIQIETPERLPCAAKAFERGNVRFSRRRASIVWPGWLEILRSWQRQGGRIAAGSAVWRGWRLPYSQPQTDCS